MKVWLDYVKDMGVKLSLQYRSSNDTTRTGDTHVETDILPSSKQHRGIVDN